MTDSDTLMRYIRIFSDLSNQIRIAATQKRVLVEIALIKTVQPGNGDECWMSVLDRIRVLEQKI